MRQATKRGHAKRNNRPTTNDRNHGPPHPRASDCWRRPPLPSPPPARRPSRGGLDNKFRSDDDTHSQARCLGVGPGAGPWCRLTRASALGEARNEAPRCDVGGGNHPPPTSHTSSRPSARGSRERRRGPPRSAARTGPGSDLAAVRRAPRDHARPTNGAGTLSRRQWSRRPRPDPRGLHEKRTNRNQRSKLSRVHTW